MALDAPTRESLVRFLTDIVGPAGAADVVTRLELDVNDLATHTDVVSLDTRVAALDTRVAALDTKVTELDTKVTALDTKVTALDAKVTALDAKVDLVRYELVAAFRGELLAAVTSQTRSMLIGMVSTAAVFSAAVLGAVQLG